MTATGSTAPRAADRETPPRRHAAVLIPLLRDAHGDLRLVVVRRTDGGPHGGQLAFPGGGRSPEDASPWETALREAQEEIGLPPERVARLAELDPLDTLTTRFRIHPFLGWVRRPPRWSLQESEIAEVLEPRVAVLLEPGAHVFDTVPLPRGGRYGPTPGYRVGEHLLWGASYRILHPLLPRLAAGEWPAPDDDL
ncbi:MAG: CoA pyrophosphatase [Thermoanaerobaculia bacterium]|nr:CoA pyrophosphatase [Thermoanaerobaculia bacterium]